MNTPVLATIVVLSVWSVQAASFTPSIISAQHSGSYQETLNYWVDFGPPPPGWDEYSDYGENRQITYGFREYVVKAHWDPATHTQFAIQDGQFSASWTIGARREHMAHVPHWKAVSYDTELSWGIGDKTITPPAIGNGGRLVTYAFLNTVFSQGSVQPYGGIMGLPGAHDGHVVNLIHGVDIGDISQGDDLVSISVWWPELLMDGNPQTWDIRIAFGQPVSLSVPEPSSALAFLFVAALGALLRSRASA